MHENVQIFKCSVEKKGEIEKMSKNMRYKEEK